MSYIKNKYDDHDKTTKLHLYHNLTRDEGVENTTNNIYTAMFILSCASNLHVFINTQNKFCKQKRELSV